MLVDLPISNLTISWTIKSFLTTRTLFILFCITLKLTAIYIQSAWQILLWHRWIGRTVEASTNWSNSFFWEAKKSRRHLSVIILQKNIRISGINMNHGDSWNHIILIFQNISKSIILIHTNPFLMVTLTLNSNLLFVMTTERIHIRGSIFRERQDHEFLNPYFHIVYRIFLILIPVKRLVTIIFWWIEHLFIIISSIGHT